MTVRLVAKTVPESFTGVTPEEFVAYVARVSNPANQSNNATAHKLLKFLKIHKHWSPFEMVHVVLEITTTRDVSRQLIRHRSFSFQEFSQRYSSEFVFAKPRTARLQDTSNRQNSIPVTDSEAYAWWLDSQDEVIQLAKTAYEAAVAKGIAKEVARAVLPEGLTMTRLYMAGNLRSWLHYLDNRLTDAQMEHRAIAAECQAVLAVAFPAIFLSP